VPSSTIRAARGARPRRCDTDRAAREAAGRAAATGRGRGRPSRSCARNVSTSARSARRAPPSRSVWLVARLPGLDFAGEDLGLAAIGVEKRVVVVDAGSSGSAGRTPCGRCRAMALSTSTSACLCGGRAAPVGCGPRDGERATVGVGADCEVARGQRRHNVSRRPGWGPTATRVRPRWCDYHRGTLLGAHFDSGFNRASWR
jgi:hypothetical protein